MRREYLIVSQNPNQTVREGRVFYSDQEAIDHLPRVSKNILELYYFDEEGKRVDVDFKPKAAEIESADAKSGSTSESVEPSEPSEPIADAVEQEQEVAEGVEG